MRWWDTGMQYIRNVITNAWVTSVNWQTWDVTVESWIQNVTTWTTTTITGVWAGTQAEYNLLTPDAHTIYYIL